MIFNQLFYSQKIISFQRMKQSFYIFLFLLFSCNDTNSDTHIYDNDKDIESCEKEAEKLFNDYGKLKEEYESG